MKNAKQKQRGIVGSGGKLINHGDTEITKRGAVDRTYKINKIYRILTDGG